MVELHVEFRHASDAGRGSTQKHPRSWYPAWRAEPLKADREAFDHGRKSTDCRWRLRVAATTRLLVEARTARATFDTHTRVRGTDMMPEAAEESFLLNLTEMKEAAPSDGRQSPSTGFLVLETSRRHFFHVSDQDEKRLLRQSKVQGP